MEAGQEKQHLWGNYQNSNKIYRLVNGFVGILIFIFDDFIKKLKSEKRSLIAMVSNRNGDITTTLPIF